MKSKVSFVTTPDGEAVRLEDVAHTHKDGHHYIVLNYDHQCSACFWQATAALISWADNPELNLDSEDVYGFCRQMGPIAGVKVF